MATQPITQVTSRPQNGGVPANRAAQLPAATIPAAAIFAPKTFGARRMGRGVSPWSLRPGAVQRQPQDGAPETTSRIATIASHLPNSLFPNGLREPEDARLTGGTRSLMRRVSGLNVMTGRKAPELSDRTRASRAQVA
jgi:hypothetical protein